MKHWPTLKTWKNTHMTRRCSGGGPWAFSNKPKKRPQETPKGGGEAPRGSGMAAARLLLPRVTRTAASSSALLHRPLDSLSRCPRSLEPPLLRPPLTVFRRRLSDATFDAQALDTRVPATVITGFLGSGKVCSASLTHLSLVKPY
jgi:hypothetical protein